jgi:hypothetical protein
LFDYEPLVRFDFPVSLRGALRELAGKPRVLAGKLRVLAEKPRVLAGKLRLVIYRKVKEVEEVYNAGSMA